LSDPLSVENLTGGAFGGGAGVSATSFTACMSHAGGSKLSSGPSITSLKTSQTLGGRYLPKIFLSRLSRCAILRSFLSSFSLDCFERLSSCCWSALLAYAKVASLATGPLSSTLSEIRTDLLGFFLCSGVVVLPNLLGLSEVLMSGFADLRTACPPA